MASVQLFIATHNRPGLLVNSLNSALNQDFESFEVIVSDNSTNDETCNLLKQFKDVRLKYIKRNPPLDPISHLNAILDEVESEYFMIFHDDDEMYPFMLKELFDKINSNSSVIAVGGNARIITTRLVTSRLILKKKYGNSLICDRDQMSYRYLIKRGIVPFPSYMYKCEIARKLRFNPEHGGKHCDVSFLMDVASLGSVYMIEKPLMNYNVSQGQDSNSNNFLNRISLLNYIRKTSHYNNNSYLIKRYRIINLYYELLQDKRTNRQISKKRKLKILRLIFKVSPFEFFPRVVVQLLSN